MQKAQPFEQFFSQRSARERLFLTREALLLNSWVSSLWVPAWTPSREGVSHLYCPTHAGQDLRRSAGDERGGGAARRADPREAIARGAKVGACGSWPRPARRSSIFSRRCRHAGDRLAARRDVSPRRVRRAPDRSSRELPPIPARAADSQDRHRCRITCSMASATPRSRRRGRPRARVRRRSTSRFVGIGENGHLAFNDPPADFDTEQPYLVVTLDEACRRQQVGEGWFASIADVPAQAISMSVRQILKSRAIICVVPDARKARGRSGVHRRRGVADGAGVDPADARRHDAVPRRESAARLSPATRGECSRAICHENRAARALRPSGQRLRRRRLQRAGPDRRSRQRWRSSGCAPPASRAALPTLITSSFEEFAASARVIAGMSDAAIAGIHMEGPYISPEDGPRGAHPRAHVTRGERRRFRAPAGRGRRPDRPRHAGAGGARRAGAHRAPGRDRRARRDRAYRGDAAADRRRDRGGRDAGDASRATAARRCCRGIRTSSGSCWRPTRSSRA